ncbi:hypothetical protein ABZS29_17670 [Kribbella sp. NPDC005582]|uniref:hypothetical protein n=1 Tax=Kribbella sp. NPDC005582 TaxID=3156893 RepID=UPI0033AA3C8C
MSLAGGQYRGLLTMDLRVIDAVWYSRTASSDDGGFTPGWWDDHGDLGMGEQVNFSVLDADDSEVARVQLDVKSDWGSGYGVSVPAEGFVEVYKIDVREDRQRRGLGTAVLRLVKAQYPGRVFIAFSEDADEFWRAVGWREYAHPKEPRSRHLFVARQE